MRGQNFRGRFLAAFIDSGAPRLDICSSSVHTAIPDTRPIDHRHPGWDRSPDRVARYRAEGSLGGSGEFGGIIRGRIDPVRHRAANSPEHT